MDENEYQKIIKENMRTSDMLFLEYVVKKCSLTMSKEDILAHTERLLRELAGENGDGAPPGLAEQSGDPGAAAPLPAEPGSDESDLQDRSRDAPEAAAEEPDSPALKKRQKKKKSVFGDLLFYGVLIVLIVGTVILTGSGEQGPRSFAGFTAQTVLTSSNDAISE